MLDFPLLRVALRAASLAAAILVAAQGQVLAQDSPSSAGAPADPVVAKVGDREVRLSELVALRDTLPEQVRQVPLERLFTALRRQIIDSVLISHAAEASGIDREPEVARRLEAARQTTLRGIYVAQIVQNAMTAQAMRATYERLKTRTAGQSQIRASHILVNTEREALAVIAELARPGADFAALARARSIGPSGANGGDLGFFDHGAMVKPFADAAFALEPGQLSPKPVRSQFGWHVIKLVARRPVPVPRFEDAAEALREEIAELAIAGLVRELRGKIPVLRFTIDGRLERPSGIRRVPR